jgi:hypothetical protein
MTTTNIARIIVATTPLAICLIVLSTMTLLSNNPPATPSDTAQIAYEKTLTERVLASGRNTILDEATSAFKELFSRHVLYTLGLQDACMFLLSLVPILPLPSPFFPTFTLLYRYMLTPHTGHMAFLYKHGHFALLSMDHISKCHTLQSANW